MSSAESQGSSGRGRVKRLLPLLALLVGGAAGFALSCGEYESCSPGEVLQFNICLPGLVDGGLPDVGGMPNPECRPPAAPDGGAMCADKKAGFGDLCAANEQCQCGLDLCAIIPGQTCGFCTRSGCLQNPSICPPGWTCYDASAYQPGYSLCVNM
jgi:hypothetical protein